MEMPKTQNNSDLKKEKLQDLLQKSIVLYCYKDKRKDQWNTTVSPEIDPGINTQWISDKGANVTEQGKTSHLTTADHFQQMVLQQLEKKSRS